MGLAVSALGVTPDGLPRTDSYYFYEPEGDGDKMEFRLIYKGPLPSQGSGGNRAREKHSIRKQFHLQLRELWSQHPHLRLLSSHRFRVEPDGPYPTVDPGQKTWLEHIADEYQRCGGRFVPLVRKRGGDLTCSLDILFLRRDNPGNIITSGGDIDNRIKVLFDGLKVPSVIADLGGMPLEPDEDPFFCLLEDDSLVTGVSVTTDRLLIPLNAGDGERAHDVQLIVRVSVETPLAPFTGRRLV